MTTTALTEPLRYASGTVRWLPLRGHDYPDVQHFLGRCAECDAHYCARMTLEQAEDRYRTGCLGQEAYEGFLWMWATGAPRFGSYPTDPPADPNALAFGERLRELVSVR